MPELPPRRADLAVTPDPTTPAQLDAGALARLRELDPDGRHGVLTRVLTAFETSLSRMLVQLAAERDSDDAQLVAGVVASVAHTLKSSSASVGALELARACSDVERRLREGQPGHLGADIERLLAAGEAALAAVRTMLRS
jgi:HPt (histidine-containing phosphotransfer) domain-containing protein